VVHSTAGVFHFRASKPIASPPKALRRLLNNMSMTFSRDRWWFFVDRRGPIT